MGVSVIIPVYNALKYLKQAVVSALEQEHTQEVILIDDGSTDGSYLYAQELAKKYNNVIEKTHPAPSNRGPAAARNLGMYLASSQYIAFLDADDYYLENRFIKAIAYLNNNPHVHAIAESIQVIPNKLVNQELLSDTIIKENLSSPLLLEKLMTSNDFFLSLDGLVIRSSIIKEIGYFDESLKRTQDSDYIWRIALLYKLHTPFLFEPVTMYRRHNKNTLRNSTNIAKNRVRFFIKWFKISFSKRLPFSVSLIQFKYFIYNKYHLTSSKGFFVKALLVLSNLPFFMYCFIKYYLLKSELDTKYKPYFLNE